MLDEKIKPMKDIPELVNGLNLPKHMAEHIYMFSGESVDVMMRAESHLMSELVDWFGKSFKILEKDDDYLTIRVTCNEGAMHFWALQYGPYVEILSPEGLRNTIKNDIKGMVDKYDK